MESKTISRNTQTKDDRDFEFLRQKGLEHIEEMSRKLWTDYNSHDPGITILEALCYAITDLGNRIRLPIPDLIVKSSREMGTDPRQFPTAKSILTSGPVSEKDYRKLMINIDGVKNAFIHINRDHRIYRHCLEKSEPGEDTPWGKLSYQKDHSPHYREIDSFALKGLYNIYFEPEHDIQILDKDSEERKDRVSEITGRVKELYHSNRNLCEDLAEVDEVKYLDVLVCGDIEIERSAIALDVMAEIMFRVKEYLSPSVKRMSLEDLMEQGHSVDAIFDGPVLDNGFISDEELAKSSVRKEILLSDLVRIVSKVPGVNNIRKLKMGLCNGSEIPEEVQDKTKQKWKICLPETVALLPRLCLKKSVTSTNLFKDVVPVPAPFVAVHEKLNEQITEHQQTISLSYDDLLPEKGTFTDVEYYRTVQNDLPQIYGTGEVGLSPKLPPERHARAKQLKGYLMFFDQILASYFGHLRNAGQLLSADIGSRSYFAAGVKDVKDFEEIVKNSGSYSREVQQILEDHDDFKRRKNEFLDHLLARFSENMNEYAFAMLAGFGEDLTNATLWHKSTLLKEYPELSQNRAQAFNYFDDENPAWDSFNVSGFKHRLARLLGIRDYSRRNLTEYRFRLIKDEDEDQWRWSILGKEDSALLTGNQHFSSVEKAENDLWNLLSLAWNPDNYVLNESESEEGFYLVLLNHDKEEVARGEQIFSNKEDALKQAEYLAEYTYQRVTDEGIFLFEHILLRPDRDDEDADDKFMKICMDSECMQCKPNDPYSLRLTIILPGWTRRFSNLYFREYAEKVIRREVPAHILCRICWIGNTIENEEGERRDEDGPMQQLQALYKKWLTKKLQNPENQKENEFLKPLADLLHDLETVYPEGKLFDCDTEEREKSDPSIVLGKSTIGELKNKKNGNE